MVQLIKAYRTGEKKADISINLQDLQDMVNGINIMVGKKEDEMTKYSGGDEIDRAQYERYKSLLKELQQIKLNFK